MSRIDDIFARSRADGRTILMPFVTGGYPSPAVTAELIPVLESAGASIIEIGIPFSDPIADGPVIASSMHEALRTGVTPKAIFDLVGDVRRQTGVGLVAMVSHSIVNRMGPSTFVADAAKAGFDGLIIPDIDTGAAPRIAELARSQGMTLSLLIAPTTQPQRIAHIARLCSGFIYLLADIGLTGERTGAPDIAARVAEVRAHTDLPIAVGFGISTAEHVRVATRSADAAIVGSALVRRLGSSDRPVEEARQFIAELATGLETRAP